MKILLLLTQDLESPSGLGRYLPLAQGLVQAGHQVQIAALHSNFNQLIEKRFVINGVDVHYVAPMHVKKRNSEKNYYAPIQLIGIMFWATLALTKAALESSADAVQVAKPHPMNGIAGLAAKYLRGKTLFLDCDDYEAGSNRFDGHWQQRIVAFFEKNIPKHAKKITTNTQFMRGNLISWGVASEKITYLPNGVDPNRFLPLKVDHIAKERRKRKLEDKKVVAYIGSLSLPSHPVDLLLLSFPKVLERVPNAMLMIVGGGEDFLALKKLSVELEIQENTIFTGRLSPEDVPLYYQLADLSVDPVHDDAAARGRSPLKMFESWISGVPFVTADVGDRCELMGEPPAGIFFTPGHGKSLANAIIEILKNQQIASSMSVRGQERVQPYFGAN